MRCKKSPRRIKKCKSVKKQRCIIKKRRTVKRRRSFGSSGHPYANYFGHNEPWVDPPVHLLPYTNGQVQLPQMFTI